MMRWLLDHQSAFSEAMKRTRDRMTQFIVVICLLGVLLAIPGWLGQIWLGMASLVPSDAVQSDRCSTAAIAGAKRIDPTASPSSG